MTNWIQELFGSKSNSEAEIPAFVAEPCWKILPPIDLADFFQHLPKLAAENSILSIEASSVVSEIESYLSERPGEKPNENSHGVIFRTPKIFYMPITEENLAGLAVLSERYAEPEGCDHVLVFDGGKIILNWYDVPADPIYVAEEISEGKVKNLCESLKDKCAYVFG